MRPQHDLGVGKSGLQFADERPLRRGGLDGIGSSDHKIGLDDDGIGETREAGGDAAGARHRHGHIGGDRQARQRRGRTSARLPPPSGGHRPPVAPAVRWCHAPRSTRPRPASSPHGARAARCAAVGCAPCARAGPLGSGDGPPPEALWLALHRWSSRTSLGHEPWRESIVSATGLDGRSRVGSGSDRNI